jgi:hypothetical protein
VRFGDGEDLWPGGGTPLVALRFVQMSGDKRCFLIAKADIEQVPKAKKPFILH